MRHRLALVFLVAVILFNAIFSVVTLSLPQYAETKVYAAGEEFALQWNRGNGPAIQKAIRTGDGLESALQGSRLLAKGGWYGNGDPIAFTTFHTLECEGGEYVGSAQTGNPFDAGPNWCVNAWKSSHREVQFVGPSYWCVKQENGSWKKQKSGAGPVKKSGLYNMTPENYEITPSVIVVLNEKDFGSTPTYGYYAQITHVRHDNEHGTRADGKIVEFSKWDAPDYGDGKNRGMDDWNGHEDNKPPDSCINPPFRKTIGNDSPPLITSSGVYNLQSSRYANNKPFLKKWGLTPETLNSTATANTTGDGSDISLPGLKCDFDILSPLTWLVCPVINGLVTLTDAMDKIINSQMTIGSPGSNGDPSQIFCSPNSVGTKDNAAAKSCAAYKKAWYSFRNIALGLLTIVGLLIIISQIADLEIFNAYTVKKILPRLIISAVLITLSWQIMQFLVTLSNDLGLAIRNIIYAPFTDILKNSVDTNEGGLFVTNLFAFGALTALGVFGVLSFALTAALSVLVAFITLVIRQLLIIFLCIVAPVAIVASVLPNTEKVYRMWWENFSKALLMFPMIAAIIAIGHVFAALSLQGGQTGGPVVTFVAFVAYFGPYFTIPATFRFAGGALSAAGNAVNRAAAPASQGLSNWRSNRRKQRYQDAKDGRLLKGETEGGRRFGIRSARRMTNKMVAGAALTPQAIEENGLTLNPKSHVSNVRAMSRNRRHGRWAKQVAEDDDIRSNMYNKNVMNAAAHDNQSKEGLRTFLRSQGMRDGKEMDTTIAKAQLVRRKMGRDGANYASMKANAQISDGDNGIEISRKIAVAANGDQALMNDMIADMQQTAKQAGRAELAPSHGDTLQTVEKITGMLPTPQGRAVLNQKDAKGNPMPGSELEAMQQAYDAEVLKKNPAGVVATLKKDRVEGVVAPIAAEYKERSLALRAAAQAHNAAIDSGDRAAEAAAAAALLKAEEAFNDTSADVTALYDVVGSTSTPPEVRDEMRKHLFGISVPTIARKNGELVIGPDRKVLLNDTDEDGNAIGMRTVSENLDITRQNLRQRQGGRQFASEQASQATSGGQTQQPTN